MDLEEYRRSASEQLRTRELVDLMPRAGKSALDIGARDGHFTRILADRFASVVALDLTLPVIDHPRVRCVEGNAAHMAFADSEFDFVLCAEVLEHIPSPALEAVCAEIERVAKERILIGVPYKQDIRVGRMTCVACGTKNPPWGHVNSFDEGSLRRLFPGCSVESIRLVGESAQQTNAIAAFLTDLAGNPYGTFGQDEPCIRCGQPLEPPAERTLIQKVLTRLGFWAQSVSGAFRRPHGNWIHMTLVPSRPCKTEPAGQI